ncbi:hypothetical protein ABEB36_011301 [Hypothenemus hampei]|uniref:Uncharacterized protein n=1 Tax=Hypothenemus hampei TaxID=57062 RepID=A0ABD1EFJ7_HYPHA
MNNHARTTSSSVNSSAGSSINNAFSVNSTVKRERQDDPEIQLLAAKFVEANKAKMAVPQRNSSSAAQNLNILSFLDNKSKTKLPSTQLNSNAEESKSIDEESVKGKFGWTLMGKVHIPYIIRSGEDYCAVRMVEMKVLNKWLTYLHQDLYNCTNIRSYYITEAEARLLNEINQKHCDYQFGREQFTPRDLIVRLSDANEFYQFLGHCYHKLVNNLEHEMPNRCGFIRINRESVVPYTVYNDQKYVPLFYFEGETDNLKLRADKLENWDLSYLKFCCKVQGIRNELFAQDSCSVISLNDIKNYFPPGTVFEDYWPKKNLDSSQLLLTGRTSLPQNVHWTRQPVAPPITAHAPAPSPKPATQAKAATNGPLHNLHHFPNNYTPLGSQPPFVSSQPRGSAIRSSYPRHMRPTSGFYSNLDQQQQLQLQQQGPPSLGRSIAYRYSPGAACDHRLDDSCWMSQYNAQKNAANNYMVLEPQGNYHQAQSNYPPPPLLQHMNGNIPRYDVSQRNYVSQGLDQLVNENPAHQSCSSRTHDELLAVLDDPLKNTGIRVSLDDLRANRIPERRPTPPPTSNIPYKIQKIQIHGKTLSLINMKGNDFRDHLVTLQDLITNYFHGVPLQNCQQVMQVLNIEVYKANAGQMQVLIEEGKYTNRNETVPLVHVRDVLEYMPQLKYMLNGMTPEGPAKRQRNS